MTFRDVSLCVFSVLVFLRITGGYFGTELKDSEPCFCQLKGNLDDCTCNVDTVDYFNNVKVFPRLRSLLVKNYFRFYKVNLKKECPFWADDSRCAMKYCHVEACQEEDLPPGLKSDNIDAINIEDDHPAFKYSENAQSSCNSDHNEELSYINTTISNDTYEEFARWSAYDDAQDNFCVMFDGNGGEEYVDLLLNPERYTGYKGISAQRIWGSIYMENCFRPKKKSVFPYIESSDINNMCLEKRVFYRAISGLHTSINIHLCSKYLLSEKTGFEFSSPAPEWGPNLEEFQRRFDPSQTNSEGPNWLKNLYFIYLLEMRALAKAGPYLEKIEYFTGNDADDAEVRTAVKDLLNVIYLFPDHFNESVMFSGDQAAKLKDEFKQHFRNISRIMDCVGCDKCKLWGKLQVHGLGTALKILFSGKFDAIEPSSGKLSLKHKNKFHLERSEVVALFNAFGRLSTSITELEIFRKLLR